MNTKYIVLTYFDNGNVYCYSYTNEKDMFTYAGGALNYNKNKQSGAEATPNVTDIQVFLVDVSKKGLTLIHDIEADK